MVLAFPVKFNIHFVKTRQKWLMWGASLATLLFFFNYGRIFFARYEKHSQPPMRGGKRGGVCTDVAPGRVLGTRTRVQGQMSFSGNEGTPQTVRLRVSHRDSPTL